MNQNVLIVALIWHIAQYMVALKEHQRAHQLTGMAQCGEYSSQVLANGKCKIVATLPQHEGHRCPDMFRCTEEVSYWLHENKERKQEVLELRELVFELQEELRNHRHRLKVLEIQCNGGNHSSTVVRRVQNLESWAGESSALQRIQAAFIYDLQGQLLNLSSLVARNHQNSSCWVAAELQAQQAHPQAEFQHSRSCHTDCSSLYYNGIDRSGIYTIELAAGGIPTDVLCDMETDGGGWTIIQSRQDGSVGFNRTWAEYKEGFGHLNGEFWLGNENIYRITSRGDYSLRIDMEDWDGNHKYAMYRSFSIEDEGNHYRLNVEGFSGTTEDSFAWYHNKRSFSTPETGNLCAEISHGGWWYHQCFYSNLNGVYYRGGGYMRGRGALGPDGIVWYGWRNTDYYSLKRVSMKIRSRAFRLHRSL
eukprot:XP_002941291.2 PREDICTED: angiopoietin-related protein 7-like [Xenopus tropicalis]